MRNRIAYAAMAGALAALPAMAQDDQDEPDYQNQSRYEQGVKETSQCTAHCISGIQQGQAILVEQLDRTSALLLSDGFFALDEEGQSDTLSTQHAGYCRLYQDLGRFGNSCFQSCGYTAWSYGLSEAVRNRIIDPLLDFYIVSVSVGISSGLWPSSGNVDDIPSGPAFQTACSSFWGDDDPEDSSDAPANADYLKSIMIGEMEKAMP